MKSPSAKFTKKWNDHLSYATDTRRVEQHSQRMAELLRRGVLEPSLAYAFLMKKGGQRIPQAKSKAKARANSRATTSEGAEAAPDTSGYGGRHNIQM